MPSTSFLKSKSHFRKPVITQELYTYFYPLPELALATFPAPQPLGAGVAWRRVSDCRGDAQAWWVRVACPGRWGGVGGLPHSKTLLPAEAFFQTALPL